MSGRPIRILRVIARLNVGGPALHVTYVTRGLDERGYRTTLVAGSVGGGEASMEYVAEAAGVSPLILPSLRREIGPVGDLQAVLRLRALIRDLRPDILHTHTAKAGAVGRIAARLAGPAAPRVVVHTFHGHVLRGYFGAAGSRLFLEVERLLARRTDALVTVSEQVRDDLVRLGVAPAEKFEVIRLGLDLEGRVTAAAEARDAERIALGLRPNDVAVVWLGRMTEIKRVDVLLRAFALLHERVPDARLLLTGDGPLRPDLERLSRSLGLADVVRFLGLRRDVAGVLAAGDVVALTSANEGTPVSLIEALAAGLPVVSTDVGGVRDVVGDGESGLLVPAGDPAAVASALERLGRDPALRARLGSTGRADVVERYAVSRLLDDLDRLYRRLLAEKEPAAI